MGNEPDPDKIAEGNERARQFEIQELLRLRAKWLDMRSEHVRLARNWGVKSADRQLAKIDARLAAHGYSEAGE